MYIGSILKKIKFLVYSSGLIQTNYVTSLSRFIASNWTTTTDTDNIDAYNFIPATVCIDNSTTYQYASMPNNRYDSLCIVIARSSK